MKILHLEPDEYYRQQFRENFSDYDLIHHDKVKNLTQVLGDDKAELVVMEMIFPDGHGFEVLEVIKKHNEYKQVPVLVYSKLEDLEDVSKAMDYGVSGFFVKGVNHIGELKNLVISLS